MSETTTEQYVLTDKEAKARDKAYSYLETMRELKQEPFAQFSGPRGQRSWNTMIDDSERIINGYTLSREAQGKEEWQSNMLDNISRVKMRAIAASVGLKVPEMEYSARNKNGLLSSVRAEIAKCVVKESFEDNNPNLHAFQEVWHILSHGVVFEYEGYRTGGAMRNRIESFDSLTGDVTTKKEYVRVDSKPYSVILNPQEFYWWDMYVRDIQDQQRLAWVQHYSKDAFDTEFSKFKKYKYVKDKKSLGELSTLQESTFFKSWSLRVEETDDYEVFRLYDKERDSYEIWVNGIPLLICPLLWGDKEKVYPFAKELSEPYANTNFFVGMPFGQIMEAYQEHKSTVINTMIDKLYRSMKKPFIYGLQNKDLFDIQDQFVDENNRFYVPDINQVKAFPYEGLNSGEFQMLRVLDMGIESLSVDKAQQGQAAGGERTARESIIADQRAREMKGVLYAALESLWWQKAKLRTQVVITHYLQDKAQAEDTDGKIVSIKGYSFGDGARGVLDIHIAKDKKSLMSQDELESRAQAMEEQGIAYKILSITKDWLDDWKYDIKIAPLAFYQENKALKGQELSEEIQKVVTLFPEFFATNKDKYLEDVLALRGKRIDEFNPPAQPKPQTPQSVLGLPEEKPNVTETV